MDLNFTLSEESLTAAVNDSINELSKAIDDIVTGVPKNERNFLNTVHAFDAARTAAYNKQLQATFLVLVSGDKQVREAANAGKKKYEGFEIGVFSRQDLYQALSEFAETSPKLSEEQQRTLDKYMLDFKRNGLALPKASREAVQALKRDISALCLEYCQNVSNDKTVLFFTKDELEGVPGIDERLKKEEKDGVTMYKVTMAYTDIFPVMRNAKKTETRKKAYEAFGTRCKDNNVAVLKDIVTKRQELAEILGFDSDASYQLDIKMAKTTEGVLSFLENMTKALEPSFKKDYADLLALKKKDHPEATCLYAYDRLYYQTIHTKQQYSVDHEAIREYFPLPHVLKELFNIYQTILSLKFVEAKQDDNNVWHKDVRKYNVYDKETNAHMGAFYMDLHPRDGKFTHAACYPIVLPFVDTSGTRHPVHTSILCNMTKPQKDKPSLLLFSEVETIFHEFGHLMHSICSKNSHGRLNWTWSAVEQDFLEVPSMMLQNWVYDKSILKKMSCHYKTTDPLPDELIKKIQATKNVHEATAWRRLIFMSRFDMAIHMPGFRDVMKDPEPVWQDIKKKCFPYLDGDLKRVSYASWMHMASGYDAGYYGYLWSEVFAKDLFTRFQKEGVLNTKIGKQFRDEILAPCALRDGGDMLKAFLGREPSNEAFISDMTS